MQNAEMVYAGFASLAAENVLFVRGRGLATVFGLFYVRAEFIAFVFLYFLLYS